MPPTFVFLRHGEPETNVAFYKEGPFAIETEQYRDTNLTPLGRTQAKIAGNALSHLKFHAILSSPLSRCIQTAEEIRKEINFHAFYLNDNLLERHGNNFPMNIRKSKSDLKIAYPNWNVDNLPDNPCRWNTCENDESMYQRLLMLILFLVKLYKDMDESMHILIVCHGDVIHKLTGCSLKYGNYGILRATEIF